MVILKYRKFFLSQNRDFAGYGGMEIRCKIYSNIDLVPVNLYKDWITSGMVVVEVMNMGADRLIDLVDPEIPHSSVANM